MINRGHGSWGNGIRWRDTEKVSVKMEVEQEKDHRTLWWTRRTFARYFLLLFSTHLTPTSSYSSFLPSFHLSLSLYSLPFFSSFFPPLSLLFFLSHALWLDCGEEERGRDSQVLWWRQRVSQAVLYVPTWSNRGFIRRRGNRLPSYVQLPLFLSCDCLSFFSWMILGFWHLSFPFCDYYPLPSLPSPFSHSFFLHFPSLFIFLSLSPPLISLSLFLSRYLSPSLYSLSLSPCPPSYSFSPPQRDDPKHYASAPVSVCWPWSIYSRGQHTWHGQRIPPRLWIGGWGRGKYISR